MPACGVAVILAFARKLFSQPKTFSSHSMTVEVKTAQISYPFKEVDIGKLFHLVHISLRSDHFFVVEEDPGFASAFVGGDRFAYECHVVSVSD